MVSEKFSGTRKHFWRGLEFIADYAQDGDKILDFGCGNGRLLELFSGKKINYTGLDVSQKLLDLAEKRYAGENINFAKIAAGQSSLPFADEYFNSIYSIAVFHHFPREHAAKMAQELYRITMPGGYVVVTAWNLWPASTRGGDRSSTRGGQKKYYKNIFKNWLQKLVGQSDLDWNDCLISFQDNAGRIFQRYHHAFTRGELEKLFTGAGFVVEKRRGTGNRNILFVGHKAVPKYRNMV